MRIMLMCCMNKNPWNKFDQNAQNHQKSQFFFDVKILKNKCINACKLIKKKGYKCLTLGWGRKPLNLWLGNRQKDFES